MSLGKHSHPPGSSVTRTALLAALATAAVVAMAVIALGIRSGPPEKPAPAALRTRRARTANSSKRAKGGPSKPHRTAKPSPPTIISDANDLYASIESDRLSPAVKGFPERVYVPNTMDGTVSEIDPTTYRVVKTLQVGGVPHHITPSWDLRHLYVDNPGSGVLQQIDPVTGNLGRTIDVSAPYNLYFTPDGKRALVVAEYDQRIEFRNPHTWALIKSLRIPGSGVDHMDFSANGSYLIVSCEYDGLVVRIDTRRMAVTGTLNVGGKPVDSKISPDGQVFFVANQALSGVSVIDPRPMRQIAFIHTGVGAHGMAVSRDGKSLYVSNRVEGTVSVIDFATRRVVSTWNVGGSPDMLQVSPNGTELWASNRFSDTVSVISTASGKVTHTIRVGSQPHGLAYFPQPGRYSIGHNGVYR